MDWAATPQDAPRSYQEYMVPAMFVPLAEHMIELAEVAEGERVLDVACGTGSLTRLLAAAAGATGRVADVDLSPQMIAVARELGSPGDAEIDYQEGSADALPFDDAEFSLLICQQGLQFFPDRPAALKQMHGALAPGGRLAVSTWRPDEEFPLLRELRRVAERHLGPIADRRHCLGDAELLHSLLREAGFREVESKTVPRTVRFRDGSVFLRLNAMALVGMSAGSKGMDEEERQRMAAAIAREGGDAAGPYTDQNGLAFELSANLATARR